MREPAPAQPTGVFRVVVALLGLAVLGALFAGLAGGVGTERLSHPAFRLAPGEVRSDQVQPGSDAGNITVDIRVLSGTIDVYVVESAVAADLVDHGILRLDDPFSYRAEWSRVGVSGKVRIELPAHTAYDIVLDNSDAYYEGDTVPDPGGVAVVDLAIRYPAEERGSIVLGALAAIPSVILVILTLVRAVRRWRRGRRLRDPVDIG